MANLKEIRNRIASVKSTRQITSAMKMVSAAKLRRAQDAITQMRPYAEKLEYILGNLTGSLDSADGNVYAEVRPVKKVLFIVITSNKGLCGGFNSNVTKHVQKLLETDYKEWHVTGSLDIVAIGKKGREVLRSKGIQSMKSYNDILDALKFENTLEVSHFAMESFVKGQYDEVRVIYNQFVNAAVQKLSDEQLLPIKENTGKQSQKAGDNVDYILEPSKEYLIQELIPKSLKISLYKALLDSLASEHGARMTAMHKATDNATEMIKTLELDYNKARQAAITNEILEIVSGANALKS